MSHCFLQRPFDDVAVAKDFAIMDIVYLDFLFHRHVCDISVGALGRGPQAINVVHHQIDYWRFSNQSFPVFRAAIGNCELSHVELFINFVYRQQHVRILSSACLFISCEWYVFTVQQLLSQNLVQS